MPFSYLDDYSPPNTASNAISIAGQKPTALAAPPRQQQASSSSSSPSSSSANANAAALVDPSNFSGGIQFQVPSYLLPNPSTSILASSVYTPPFFQADSPAYYDGQSWAASSSSLDGVKSYQLADKGLSYPSATSPVATNSSRASTKEHSLPFDFDDSPTDDYRRQHHFNNRDDDFPPSTRVANSTDIHRYPSPSTLSHFPILDSAHDLPVYSQSGFDMLSILARIATRPNPTVTLGPVDMSCAFVVVDVRQDDAPIIYASRSFLELTGYPENEVIGKNCRFLQAPGGQVRKGELRKSTSSDAVSELKWSTGANRECQVSMINYRKDGKPFVNRITVIPVPPLPGHDDVEYYAGFQVDLNESPSIIVQRIRDGNYFSDLGRAAVAPSPAERCSRVMSKELRGIIFQSALPLTTSANVTQEKPSARDAQQWIDLLLLEQSADFVHALSLKGQFLYVSPSTRDTLGYEPLDLLGVSIADVCHPSDVVPLLRELKESTNTTTTTVNSTTSSNALPSLQSKIPARSTASPDPKSKDMASTAATPLKTVDLLFRIQTKAKRYVWVECVGKLYSDAGKNRKAIILSGRVSKMPSLQWDDVVRAGGLAIPRIPEQQQQMLLLPNSNGFEASSSSPEITSEEREFWSVLSPRGIFLAASVAVRSLLGWGPGEVIGRSLKDFVVGAQGDGGGGGDVSYAAFRERLWELRATGGVHRSVQCSLRTRAGGALRMSAVLYGPKGAVGTTGGACSISRLVVQFKVFDGQQVQLQQKQQGVQLTVRDLATNIFEELETERSSTWQYEVQQQKIANRRLFEDVRELEADLRL